MLMLPLRAARRDAYATLFYMPRHDYYALAARAMLFIAVDAPCACRAVTLRVCGEGAVRC